MELFNFKHFGSLTGGTCELSMWVIEFIRPLINKRFSRDTFLTALDYTPQGTVIVWFKTTTKMDNKIDYLFKIDP